MSRRILSTFWGWVHSYPILSFLLGACLLLLSAIYLDALLRAVGVLSGVILVVASRIDGIERMTQRIINGRR